MATGRHSPGYHAAMFSYRHAFHAGNHADVLKHTVLVATLKHLIEKAGQSLTADGQLLACHWRPPIDGCPLNARQVHDLLHEQLHLPRLVLHQEADFLLEIWSREPRSVAALEGLR